MSLPEMIIHDGLKMGGGAMMECATLFHPTYSSGQLLDFQNIEWESKHDALLKLS